MLLQYLVERSDNSGCACFVCIQELEIRRETVDAELMVDMGARLIEILFCTEFISGIKV